MSAAPTTDEPVAPADDADLVGQLAQGDPAAARLLYERHVRGLLRFAVAIGGCRQTAEDAVHDTFIELLRHPARFDPRRGSLSAYLYSITRHRMARIARSARRHVDLHLGEAHEVGSTAQANVASVVTLIPTARAASLEEETERAYAIAQVRAAILSLPLLQREVIALCDLEELPYADVALILHCPVGTVRSRLHRARALLARELQAIAAHDPAAANPARREAASRIGVGNAIDAAADPPLLPCRGT